MILSYSEAEKIKKEIEGKFAAKLHFHDVCGGQFFSLDEKNEELKAFIINYFLKKGAEAVFSDDGLQFYVKRGRQC